MLHKYEQPLYPFELYIGIDKNLENLLDNFSEYDGTPAKAKTDSIWNNNCDGTLYYQIKNKDTNYNSYLMAFPEVPSIPLFVHEAQHAVYRINEYIGEDKPGNEANAYLIEWIVKCRIETINIYNNDTHLENNK